MFPGGRGGRGGVVSSEGKEGALAKPWEREREGGRQSSSAWRRKQTVGRCRGDGRR